MSEDRWQVQKIKQTEDVQPENRRTSRDYTPTLHTKILQLNIAGAALHKDLTMILLTRSAQGVGLRWGGAEDSSLLC